MSGSRPVGPRLSRRRLLAGGAAALGAMTVPLPQQAAAGQVDGAPISPYGPHQAGLEPPLPAHAVYIAFDLRAGVRRADLARWMTVWADDIARLTAGRPTLADTAPELAGPVTGLTATVGFGPGLFQVPGLADQRPDWLAPLPRFGVDELQERWSGGDVIMQLRGEDPLDLSHAQQMLITNADEFATVRWIQRGFQRAAAVRNDGETGRNLMGYVDGTVNPARGSDDFASIVWTSTGPQWIRGGTGMVIRRIQMDLDRWGAVDRVSREMVMGRRMDGAPLTGTRETDVPDLGARDANGLLTIPEFAHIRLAHQVEQHEQISRQPYNYDDTSGPRRDAGLIFVAYAADPTRQFVPIQRRLDQGDALNTWITPIGSAVFAMPPGYGPGGFPGEALLG